MVLRWNHLQVRQSYEGGIAHLGDITVNGIHRALLALSIMAESHETLKQLKLTTLKIISAGEGEILKITFVRT